LATRLAPWRGTWCGPPDGDRQPDPAQHLAPQPQRDLRGWPAIRSSPPTSRNASSIEIPRLPGWCPGTPRKPPCWPASTRRTGVAPRSPVDTAGGLHSPIAVRMPGLGLVAGGEHDATATITGRPRRRGRRAAPPTRRTRRGRRAGSSLVDTHHVRTPVRTEAYQWLLIAISMRTWCRSYRCAAPAGRRPFASHRPRPLNASGGFGPMSQRPVRRARGRSPRDQPGVVVL